ncbi:hypothetical protein PENTCL1PPCAC_27951, partial [Pristionchus entomophagus]
TPPPPPGFGFDHSSNQEYPRRNFNFYFDYHEEFRTLPPYSLFGSFWNGMATPHLPNRPFIYAKVISGNTVRAVKYLADFDIIIMEKDQPLRRAILMDALPTRVIRVPVPVVVTSNCGHHPECPASDPPHPVSDDFPTLSESLQQQPKQQRSQEYQSPAAASKPAAAAVVSSPIAVDRARQVSSKSSSVAKQQPKWKPWLSH